MDARESHYVKVALDELFGRECFLNEVVWAYDYGGRPKRRWAPKHDSILVYVRDPERYWFSFDEVDRVPYMAPGLVGPEKAARGKLPTDVWWHTIVPTAGTEKTGYPTQKPLGVVRRAVAASSRPGDRVLDCFAGSGTTAAAARAHGPTLRDGGLQSRGRGGHAPPPGGGRGGLRRARRRPARLIRRSRRFRRRHRRRGRPGPPRDRLVREPVRVGQGRAASVDLQ